MWGLDPSWPLAALTGTGGGGEPWQVESTQGP